MKLLLEYLKPYRLYITWTLTIKTAATLVELIIPYILSHILDNVVPMRSVRQIVLWGVAMLVCAGLACVGNIVANRMAARTARRSTEKIRHALFSRVLSLSSRQLDAFTIPSLESRLTSDTYHIHHFVGMSLRMGVRAPILLIGGIIVTATLDPVLTLVMVLVLPLISVSVFVISKKGIPLFRKTQQSVDSMIRIVREDAQGIRVIKALSKTDYERRKYDAANRRLVEDEKRASTTMAASNPLVTFFLNLGLVTVMVVGAFRVNGNLSEPGKIIAFIQYFTMISTAMIGITRIFVNYSKGAASAGRIEEVIRTQPDLAVASGADYPTRAGERGVVFDDVSFSYLGKQDNLSHVSFTLPQGGTLGIIGATGSGKTTLIQLLMRFYDVDSGSIRIDGRDVRTIPHDELNTMFGVVMQNDFIHAGTIAENIRFGREISDEAMRHAASMAQAAEFIEQYEDGYEHPLQSKGTNVSGGQKQRLLIARALAGAPRILVLDDASSALDYKTDSALRRSIRENMSQVTTVVVAQRVSSVMHADLILVLDEGRIIGSGTHDELLESCQIYREISDSQIGGAFLE
ncbi:MAG: ABC transporter ATP-binding protein [Clostridia bacterium]|nr:ABC transporter ATP-binding protein [Clostridia bacterium]